MIALAASAGGGVDDAGAARVRGSRAELLTALINGSCHEATVSMALTIVEGDPLASAGHFGGDLLRGLMEIDGRFWSHHPGLYDRYRGALRLAALLRRELPAAERMEFWSATNLFSQPL